MAAAGAFLLAFRASARILRPALANGELPLTSISASSQLSASTLLQQLLAATQSGAVQGAGQDQPAPAASSASPAEGPAPPPPPKPDDSGASRLTSDTLASLLQQQDQPSSSSPFSGIASQLISADDSDGSGGLSLGEIESALGVGGANSTSSTSASASTDAQSQVAQVFAQLDTNGDGSLSQDELTSALQQNAPQGAGGAHHGHHHHHGGGGVQAPSSTTTSSTTTATTTATSTSDPDDANPTLSVGAQALAA